MRLDSYCKYTKNYANHNLSGGKVSALLGWILIANILKIMRITTLAILMIALPWVGFLLQIY